MGTGEGAFDVAEEFAFEEGFGDASAGELDEGGVSSRGEVVDGVGDEAFAGAAFAAHEDGGSAGRDGADEVEDFDHSGVGAGDVGEGVTVFELAAEVPVFRHEGVVSDGAFEAEAEFAFGGGLGEEVDGAVAEGFDGALDGAVTGEHDGGGAAAGFDDFAEEVEAASAGEADVDDGDADGGVGAVVGVGSGGGEGGAGFFEGGCDLRAEAFGVEELGEAFADEGVVIDDEDANAGCRRGGHGRAPS